MHTHEKSNTSFVPPVTKSESAGLQTRPFQVATPQSTTAISTSLETTEPDIQAKIDHASCFGHDLTQAYQQGSEMPVQRQVELTDEREDEEEAPIQAKLTIGQPGDKYEQEADVIAAKVMAMPDAAVGLGEGGNTKEEGVQRAPMLEEEDKEKETLQAKPQIQSRGVAPAVPAGFENQLAQHKGGGQPLSDETRAFMETRFGRDFSNVRVHETPDLANAIQAQAFTHGQDIYFNSGKYSPRSSGGKELLAHELTHVVQQTHTDIQCVQAETKQKETTYWDWYYDTPKGRQYQKDRKLLEADGYKFRRRVAIGQNSNGSKIWKEGSPQKDTLAKDVAWRITLPRGEGYAWANIHSINDKCEKFIASGSSCTNDHDLKVASLIKQYRARGLRRYNQLFGKYIIAGHVILGPYTKEFYAWNFAREDYRPVNFSGGDYSVLRDAEHFLLRYWIASIKGETAKIPRGIPLNIPSEINPRVPLNEKALRVHDAIYNRLRPIADDFLPISPTTPNMADWENRGYKLGICSTDPRCSAPIWYRSAEPSYRSE